MRVKIKIFQIIFYIVFIVLIAILKFDPYRTMFYICIASILIIIVYVIKRIILKVKINKKIRSLSSSAIEITPKEFLKIRNAKIKGNTKYVKRYDFEGVYILFNESKNMYYVGQAAKVFNRVNQHFTGKGNGDVYADYKYGDHFLIKMIRLSNSGFNNLNELERVTISSYKAYNKGYNKTRGNK